MQGQERILAEHLDGHERNDFCDFDKPRKRVYQKEIFSPTSKTRREASRNEFMEKGAMPDKVKSLGEIDSIQDRRRARSVHGGNRPGGEKEWN